MSRQRKESRVAGHIALAALLTWGCVLSACILTERELDVRLPNPNDNAVRFFESTPMTNRSAWPSLLRPYCSTASNAPSPEFPAAVNITSAPRSICDIASSFPRPGLFHAESESPT